MYIVHCPNCLSEVRIVDEAIERRDINWNWQLVYCHECGLPFNFKDEDVLQVPDTDKVW